MPYHTIVWKLCDHVLHLQFLLLDCMEGIIVPQGIVCSRNAHSAGPEFVTSQDVRLVRSFKAVSCPDDEL